MHKVDKPVQVPLQREGGAAEAFVGPGVGVNGHVTLKVVMPGKFLAANRALIRLLLSVSHHVSF